MCANAAAQEATKCGVYVRYFLSLSIKVLLCHIIINTFLSHFFFFYWMDTFQCSKGLMVMPLLMVNGPNLYCAFLYLNVTQILMSQLFFYQEVQTWHFKLNVLTAIARCAIIKSHKFGTDPRSPQDKLRLVYYEWRCFAN